MSIATEITRLQGAKASLKTAIEGKGVTVPSATKLDGYADLVDAIETGGGGGAPELVGYLDAQMIDGTSLLDGLDINQDGQITIADYNAIAKGDPADIVNYGVAIMLVEAYIENPTTSLDAKKYAQDFVSGGFAGLAIPILADGDTYIWVVIDFGYIIDHNGDMQFANYAVYRGAVPYNVPYAFGTL